MLSDGPAEEMSPRLIHHWHFDPGFSFVAGCECVFVCVCAYDPVCTYLMCFIVTYQLYTVSKRTVSSTVDCMQQQTALSTDARFYVFIFF